MASRHVQRILSPRSRTNSLNSERDAFEKLQAISISKAVSNIESPVKEKHVRRIIIGTFQEKSACTFWNIIRKQPIQDSPICCWKFCHTLHKVLREGYRKTIIDSYKYKQYILDSGKLFGLLKEGYGKLIQNYSTLLVNKIEFHMRNPKFPGNLMVTDEELELIGENDVNVFFQLSCEMFDYLDEILCLQSSIFGTLDMSRASSMTSHGQCKLAPLIPCIQDSSQLYDYIVKVLFKLHNVLPSTTLDGHRVRFLNQFKILKQFYINSSNLQYFRNLIQIPKIPEKPPNFLLASDINMHVTPIVVLEPNQQRESPDGIEHVENLVDLSFAEEQEDELALVRRESQIDDDFDFDFASAFNNNNSNDNNINNNQGHLKAIENGNLVVENLKQKITELEVNKVELERKIVQLKIENEHILKEKDELKAELSRAEVGTDVLIEKERALEKLNKVKDFYNSLRNEHIDLLRKKAEVDKELIKIKSDYEKLEQDSSNLKRNLNNDNSLKDDYNQLLNKNESIKEFNSKLLSEISTIKQEKDKAIEKLNEMELNLKDYKDVQNTEMDRFKQKFIIKLFNLLIGQLKQHLKQILDDDEFENYNLPNISSSPEYFFDRFNDLKSQIDDFTGQYKNLSNQIRSNDNEEQLMKLSEQCTKNCVDFNYNLVYLFFMTKILQQSITNLNTSEELNTNFKELTNTFISFYDQLININKKRELNFNQLDEFNGKLIEQINCLVEMKSKIMPHLSSVESKNLEQLLEQEIADMDKAIKEAVNKIETLLQTSKREDKDIKLEVNSNILEQSSNLMKAVMQLVNDSRELQKEIVMEGKGSSNVKEFYQKNNRWTEGLITASKVVAYSCKLLVDTADQVVGGKADFANIIVASQEIAASTAQLVAASRVKANSMKSVKLNSLLKSSKNVTKSTTDVISTTKNCINLLNQEQNEQRLEEELQKLTIHNAKKLEMECQLNIIKLEDSLIKERLKLSSLRRVHYHLNE